jgi:hypothetical protein
LLRDLVTRAQNIRKDDRRRSRFRPLMLWMRAIDAEDSGRPRRGPALSILLILLSGAGVAAAIGYTPAQPWAAQIAIGAALVALAALLVDARR